MVIQTVGELRRLLSELDDATPLAVMPTPDINGYANYLEPVLGTAKGERGVFLALAEETINPDEIEVEFTRCYHWLRSESNKGGL